MQNTLADEKPDFQGQIARVSLSFTRIFVPLWAIALPGSRILSNLD
jgi:hypothetical protein